MLAAGTMQSGTRFSTTPGGGDACRDGQAPVAPLSHIHMIVRVPGHRSVTTHLFDSESDFVLVPGDAGEPVALGRTA